MAIDYYKIINTMICYTYYTVLDIYRYDDDI